MSENYAEGQHRMICELMGVSDDQDAAGASAYEAVVALQAGRAHIEMVSERMTQHAKASRRELDDAKEQAMKVLVAEMEDGTPFVMLSEAKWQGVRAELERLRSRLHWFENAGGVTMATRIFELMSAVERLRALCAARPTKPLNASMASNNEANWVAYWTESGAWVDKIDAAGRWEGE
jgi:hypothetical protein